MSTDYSEKEREFLAALEADTGRGLDAWMAAISAQRLADKNEVIDWLRQQGFMFWKASWLERIHSNGGRPIYATGGLVAEAAPQAATVAAAPAPAPAPPLITQSAEPPPSVTPAPPPSASRQAVSAAAVPASSDAALDDLLVRAKALRPLARHVLKEIARIVPEANFTAAANHVSIATTTEFAVLTISPRELKLGLSLPGEPFEPPLEPARFAVPAHRISSAISHMAVLTDARQINGMLLGLIARCAARDIQ